MDKSEAGSATPVTVEGELSSDWDVMFAAARIESPQPGGQEPVLTSATQGSASAQDTSGADESFWDKSFDQLAVQAQMAFYQRQTSVQGSGSESSSSDQ